MSSRTLELQRVLPAAPAVVFAAFTEPSQLARWWGPRGFTVPRVEFDSRVGAAYRFEMRPPDGESFHLTGVVQEVERPSRLAYTFVWEPPDPDDVETTAELSFRAQGDATLVALTQGPFKTDERRELHRGGWTESLDRLAELLAVGDD